MTSRKEVHTIISLYEKRYKEVYNSAPTMNRNRMRWGFEDMLNDLGRDRTVEVIDWYFTLKREHSVWDLLSMYDRFSDTMKEQEEDRKYREELRRRTAQKVAEFRKKRESERTRVEGPSGGSKE